jgi:hypothetical protein
MVSLSNHCGRAFTRALRQAQDDPALFVISNFRGSRISTQHGDFLITPTPAGIIIIDTALVLFKAAVQLAKLIVEADAEGAE